MLEKSDGFKTPNLSPRQQQIAVFIAYGLTNREIAGELGVSVFTVRNELTLVFSKLKVRNRSQVAFLMGQGDFTGIAPRFRYVPSWGSRRARGQQP